MANSSFPITIAEKIIRLTEGNNQISYIEEIIHVLTKFIQNKQTTITVYSAEPLSDDILLKIKESVEHIAGTPLNIKNTIDNTVLAGFVIRYKDSVYDFGLGSKLKQIKQHYGY